MAPDLRRRLIGRPAPAAAAADQRSRTVHPGTSAGDGGPAPLTLLLAGDVMLGRLVDEVLRGRPAASVWGDTLPLFRAADLRVCNLECALSDVADPRAWPEKAFHFRSGERNVAALAAAGIDMVSLANNHALDVGEAALLRTLAVLDEAGIGHAGAGRTLDEARAPAIRSARGVRVGVVAFTDNEPDWAAGARRPGVFHVDVEADEPEWETLLEAVRAARAAVDVLVVSAHWGPNWGNRPLPGQVRLAHELVGAGADVVFGHSGHVVRGVEIHRGRPVLYCTGDVVDDYAVDPIERNDHGAIFLVDVVGPAVVAVRIRPTVIRDFSAWLATGAERDAITERLARLATDLGTRTRLDAAGDMVTVSVEEAAVPVAAGAAVASRRE